MDGEGCFHVSVRKTDKLKIGFMISHWFEIHIHLKDEEVLIKIKEQLVPPLPPTGGGGGEGDLRGPVGDPPLGVGNIYYSGQSVRLKVQSLKELRILINFFQNYKLITQKRADCQLFCDVVNLV